MELLGFDQTSMLTEVLLIAAVVVGLLFALGAGRRLRAELRESDRLRTRLARLESQTKDQGRMVAQMRREDATVASLALSLPSVVRELNRADLDPRRIPGLILNLAEAIFQPGQILFYVARGGDRGHNGRKELHLISHKGLTEIPDSIKRIPFGEGKVGWVAEQRLDKLKEDWHSLARTDGMVVRDNHKSLNLDVIGPLMHHTGKDEQVLGVLCLGDLAVQTRDEKLMFQMVTNLGSLALVNAMNVSRLREQANHDGLTGLLNKSYFMHELASLMLTTQREAQQLALFIFDIDHFKNYNDNNGHPAGDALLRRLAGSLKSIVRPGDWCCRYGGEEFMVAMPQTNGRDAMAVAERIRRAIEDETFEQREKQPSGAVTISGGVSVFPKDGDSIEELIEHADQALYKSKTAGRNRVTRFRLVSIGELDDDCAPEPESELEPQNA